MNSRSEKCLIHTNSTFTIDVSRIPFPTVIGQEQQKPLLNKNELVPFREMSPISQLSQSTDRTNTPPVKDIQRDEPMLGFE
jgi:hypothetical protein